MLFSGMFHAVSLCISLYVLVKATDKFIEGSAAMALHWHVKPMLIGLTLVAFGTSLPEALVSIIGGLLDTGNMVIGNVLGSNIANITLGLGLAMLICQMHVHKKVLRLELPALLFATLLTGLLLIDFRLSRQDGILMLLVWGFILFLFIRFHGQGDLECHEEMQQAKTLRQQQAWLYFIIGLLLLVISARWLVWSAQSIATMLGISELVIGLTVIAIGTSLPEITVSVMSAWKGQNDIALGNIVGSNIFNTLMVLALALFIHDIEVATDIIWRDYAANMLFTTLLFGLVWYASRKNRLLGKKTGVVFTLFYLVYLGCLANTGLNVGPPDVAG